MAAKLDLVGEVFGKLTVKSFSGQRRTRGGQSVRTWLCECECGTELTVDTRGLTSGNTKTCGCTTAARKHGMWQARIYQTWADMKIRCDNPKNKAYPSYGGRGIGYQESWKDFENFLSDMSEGYEDHLTLDRIDPNGDYTKENCRWITKSLQARNKGINSRNKTGVTGIHEWVDKKVDTEYFVATAKGLDGKILNKYFSKKKYGEEEAFRLACEYRDKMIVELNEQGAGYGVLHGKSKEDE